MNGMKNEIVMKALKKQMGKQRTTVLFVTEAFLSVQKQKEVTRVFKDYDVFFRSRKEKGNKQYKKRGGIVCIARKGEVKMERECKSDDLMFVSWRDITLVCAYFVPPSSTFEKYNEKRMIELQERVLECRNEVILLTDANAWIGELPSEVGKTEDGFERSTLTFPRTSEKKEVNEQGRQFVVAMNSIDLVILNGVRSQARYTYDHPGREARSIVDYIATRESLFSRTSKIEYTDCREVLETDHILISINVQHATVVNTRAMSRRPKPSVMERLKKVTRKDPFWKSLEITCNEKLEQYTTNAGQDINRDYKRFVNLLNSSVTSVFQQVKPYAVRLTARIQATPELRRLKKRKKECFVEMKSEGNEERRKRLKRDLSSVSRELKKEARKVINKYKRCQVKEIEALEPDDCRRMWKELKALSGWNRKEEASDTVLDEKEHEVDGEGIMRVWKEAFQGLGIENVTDDKFDREFCEKTIKNVERIEEESYQEANANEALDSPITLEETVEAIRRLKLGKSAGCDEVVAEVLLKGGDQVHLGVFRLCQKVWETEKLPEEWTKGIIFPIYKDGDKRDTSNYRGITLLSIVGKVYTHILNGRLMSWSEENDILVEEQGGFRPRRGCPDQLFSLVEVLRNRGKKATFACFIDVRKAFDRVFRAGLWQRMAEEGVRGKLWRVIRSIYNTVESSVKVKGKQTEWFEIGTGVRQGCVLSPLLYAFFINGLVKEINRANLGIVIGSAGQKLSALLYADDIVLVTDTRQKLQQMLDIVTNYAKKWRFELNPKKSEVVVFGARYPPRNVVWRLGGNNINQVTRYKYLGIELTRTLRWRPYIDRILKKAKRNMTQALAMGVSGGFMTVRLACIVWKSLVRSIVEYGCEIWGDKKFVELEKLQVEMGKRILRCGSRTPDVVVRGELGWERQKARHDEMRLRYWGRIVSMRENRIVKTIYRASKERLEREEEHGREITHTWCSYTKKLMHSLNLTEEWRTESIPPEEEWNKLVREKIHEREQIKWRTTCLLKPKLRTYSTLKKQLRTEPFLKVYDRVGIPELVKIRGGTNRLRIEQGRYKKEERSQRICEYCIDQQVEDEEHFMLKCTAYKSLREKMWKQFEEVTGVKKASLASEAEQLNALIGDKFQPSEDDEKDSTAWKNYKDLAAIVMEYIKQAMNRRRGLQR